MVALIFGVSGYSHLKELEARAKSIRTKVKNPTLSHKPRQGWAPPSRNGVSDATVPPRIASTKVKFLFPLWPNLALRVFLLYAQLNLGF
jgi:hypothetical protein